MNTKAIMSNDILVSHVGRRDYYELAYALTLSRRRVHLVTDFYFQPKSILGRIAKFMYGKNVNKRYRPDLNVKVHSSILLFLLDVVEHLLPRNKIVNQLRGYELGRVCLSVVKRYNISDAFLYYNSGLSTLAHHKLPIKLNLFQMHPHAKSLKQIYQRYIEKRPKIAEDILTQEEELTSSTTYFDMLVNEAHIAERVICTSEFVRKTLLDDGIDPDKIVVIPYGNHTVDLYANNHARTSSATKDVIRLAFVGQYVVRKGVYELMLLAQRNENIKITFFTRNIEYALKINQNWFGSSATNVDFLTIHDNELMWNEAIKHDFLILPSLAEGYGLVITEAMAHGLPVIGTRNSAASDLIIDGKSGFLIDDIFECDLNNVIQRALLNKSNWSTMRNEAKNVAALHSWYNFQIKILSLLTCVDN